MRTDMPVDKMAEENNRFMDDKFSSSNL